MTIHISKGVFDILPYSTEKWKESHLWHYIETVASEMATLYGYHEIRTPLFEDTKLFHRSAGATSDIVVKKEMYTFQDRGDRSLTLRPEGTAPVLRAFIENNLAEKGVQKFFYLEPMFRYERQQAGRYRQHHQFGVEAIGSNSPYQDVEVIHLLFSFFQKLGIRGLTLHLNSLGEKETRKIYGDRLKEFLQASYDQLSPESQERFHANPLRILDSKSEQDKFLLQKAPSLTDLLEGKAKEHFDTVCTLLKEAHIPYQINPKLVRGLDYYSHTVFEITAEELGAQNSLGGGGRYDGLIKELGGPDLPSIGFGAGLERIIQTMLAQQVSLPEPPKPLLFIIPLGERAHNKAFSLVCALRAEGIAAEMDFSERKLKSSMRYADSLGAHYVIVLGDAELESATVELKNMLSGGAEKVPLSQLSHKLK